MTLDTSLLILFMCLIFSGGVVAYMLIWQKPFQKNQEEKEDIKTNNEIITTDKIEK
ncbi:hypothetical protein [Bacillus cereus]|uniref:hypothetical protein n=1 Tax=Bacillus cereus TaxID=1396 RepID=UPI00159B87C5|nr:hypothetical protein [Bacillus cereus]